jgi:hypothetical protein
MSSIQALIWNVRTSPLMPREMTSGYHREEEYRCKGRGAEPFVVVMKFL